MPDAATLRSIVRESRIKVTDPVDGVANGSDDITTTDDTGEIIPVCDMAIWDLVLAAPDMAEIQARMPALLGMEAA